MVMHNSTEKKHKTYKKTHTHAHAHARAGAKSDVWDVPAVTACCKFMGVCHMSRSALNYPTNSIKKLNMQHVAAAAAAGHAEECSSWRNLQTEGSIKVA